MRICEGMDNFIRRISRDKYEYKVLADEMSQNAAIPTNRLQTESEAVEWVMRHKLPVHGLYRKRLLVFYGRNQGAQFAESVRREVEKRWKARNAQKI